MRWKATVLALVWLAAGCAHAEDELVVNADGSITAPSLTTLPEPDCGKGPHTIEVMEPIACEDACERGAPMRMADGTYMAGVMHCKAVACYSSTEQEWSDWPECHGAKPLLPDEETTWHYDSLP